MSRKGMGSGLQLRPGTVIAALVLALACGGIAVAAAGSGGGSNAIRTCVTKNGLLRFLGRGSKGTHAKCKHRLSFNEQGRSAPSADLAVAIAGPSSVPSGSHVSFSVTVRNAGPAATWVGLNDTPPQALEGSPTPSSDHGICSGLDASGTFTCQIGILERSQTATIKFNTVGCPTPSHRLTDTAKVVGSSFDPNLANNRASKTVTQTSSNTGCG